MSIEDRSLDALKEEGTATVIDGSNDKWNRHGDAQHPFRLYSMNQGGLVAGHYLYIDGNGSLRTDAAKENDATGFTIHMIESDGHQIVILEHINTQKVVAIDTENDTVIAKSLPTEKPLKKLHNSEAINPEWDILFYKIPMSDRTSLFHLKSYRDDKRMVGFDKTGAPMRTTKVDFKNFASIFKIDPN
ncbi:uncharacterized protein LOC111338789 [Stylophora pistillata]|uniref:Uncharacterized protein n=1 Tax=Stylophora pistillata TaxID=50429 RepID=A0A2B4RQ90_STYPI|nr:uncharacterized protein LOC111338789 [Stylophora pistillata]PFX18973.1 hypothetical protein AWC38_SpisGene16624 [Stylophora pistillata]